MHNGELIQRNLQNQTDTAGYVTVIASTGMSIADPSEVDRVKISIALSTRTYFNRTRRWTYSSC